MWCAALDLSNDPRGCMTTNSGGGLKVAGNVLGRQYPTGFVPVTGSIPLRRETATWVVVWLTDGFTNAGFGADGANDPQTFSMSPSNPSENNSGQPFCPRYTWDTTNPHYMGGRLCVDQDARPTVSQLQATPPPGAAVFAARHTWDAVAELADPENGIYDPDDYARDMVDFVTDPVHGQGALLFTVGLGDKVAERSAYEIANDLPAPGTALLQYGAEKGGGVYYPAPNASQLNDIFLQIANKIAPRLTR